jgi:hypothetical protein
MGLTLRHRGVRIARFPKADHKVRQICLSAFIEVEKIMTLKTKTLRTSLHASLLLAILLSLFFNSFPALALEKDDATLPELSEFVAAVHDGEAGVLRGVYVPDVLAFPIVQQPAKNANFVSSIDGIITQFNMPAQFGNVGLLAHNNLSGRFFFDLAVGQDVRLVYGDGKIETFVITEILKYQALQPSSPYSSFRDLETNDTLTTNQMFQKVYLGDRHVTFQTCIAANGNSSWGRIFVMATPKPENLAMERFEGK